MACRLVVREFVACPQSAQWHPSSLVLLLVLTKNLSSTVVCQQLHPNQSLSSLRSASCHSIPRHPHVYAVHPILASHSPPSSTVSKTTILLRRTLANSTSPQQ